MKLNLSPRSRSLARHLACTLLVTSSSSAMVQAADLLDAPGPGYRTQAGHPVEALAPIFRAGPVMAPRTSPEPLDFLRPHSWPIDPRSIGAPVLPKTVLHSDPLLPGAPLPDFNRDNPFSRSIRLFDGAPR